MTNTADIFVSLGQLQPALASAIRTVLELLDAVNGTQSDPIRVLVVLDMGGETRVAVYSGPRPGP